MKQEFQKADDLFGSLDDLLKDAMNQAANRNRAKANATKDSRKEKAERPKLTPGYYEAGNWQLSRTIALIHQPTDTLLGNFHEYLYIGEKVLNISQFIPRKLVRVHEPTATQAVEAVTGDWWLRQETELHQDSARWVESRSAVIGISLHECQLYCDAAEVMVRLEHGWIARVELQAETRFHSVDRSTFLILPKGLDVLEAMSFDCKVALKSELRIGEEE